MNNNERRLKNIMGKNNKTNSEIYESLIEDYIEDNNISKISSVISNIHNLIDDNLGWKITKNEYGYRTYLKQNI